MAKVTIVITVLNEESSISELLRGLEKQTLQPREVIIVDGGSTDETVNLIKDFNKKSNINITLFIKKGNRSLGRNLAIKKAKTNLIAITDAGCVPNPNWLEELIKTQKETNSPVIAGYYAGEATTRFEEAVIPYALVMPDKVNPDNFLPATRSMLLQKKVWENLGGFDENLSENEDYDFAKRIKKNGINIAFAKNAVVIWQPRSNLKSFFKMILKFARGDIQARILRPKVILIFARYLLLLLATVVILKFSDWRSVLQLWTPVFVLYSICAIDKNVRYTPRGWYYLPVLQITSDVAVMIGSLLGITRK